MVELKYLQKIGQRSALAQGAGEVASAASRSRQSPQGRHNYALNDSTPTRELGRVVGTIFLLQYISDLELRQVIQAATNKSEAFNKFVQWVCFGGEGVITENVRDEQRKFIKYNHLVANLLSFHTLVTRNAELGADEGTGARSSYYT